MRGKAIIVKGDDTNFYDEIIFVMKDEKELANKIIARNKKICRGKIMFESIFYFVMFLLAIALGTKIIFFM